MAQRQWYLAVTLSVADEEGVTAVRSAFKGWSGYVCVVFDRLPTPPARILIFARGPKRAHSVGTACRRLFAWEGGDGADQGVTVRGEFETTLPCGAEGRLPSAVIISDDVPVPRVSAAPLSQEFLTVARLEHYLDAFTLEGAEADAWDTDPAVEDAINAALQGDTQGEKDMAMYENPRPLRTADGGFRLNPAYEKPRMPLKTVRTPDGLLVDFIENPAVVIEKEDAWNASYHKTGVHEWNAFAPARQIDTAGEKDYFAPPSIRRRVGDAESAAAPTESNYIIASFFVDTAIESKFIGTVPSGTSYSIVQRTETTVLVHWYAGETARAGCRQRLLNWLRDDMITHVKYYTSDGKERRVASPDAPEIYYAPLGKRLGQRAAAPPPRVGNGDEFERTEASPPQPLLAFDEAATERVMAASHLEYNLKQYAVKQRPAFDVHDPAGRARCMRCGINKAVVLIYPCLDMTYCAGCQLFMKSEGQTARCAACGGKVERDEECEEEDDDVPRVGFANEEEKEYEDWETGYYDV